MITLDRIHAITVAALVHKEQYREGTEIPYVVHPFEVYETLQEMGAKKEVCIAGLLHDAVDGATITIKDIREQFGVAVAALVCVTSACKYMSWEERRIRRLDYILARTEASYDSVQLIFADELSNIRNLVMGLEVTGPALWEGLCRDFLHYKWYYSELLLAFQKCRYIPHLFFGLFAQYYHRAFLQD